MIDEPISTFLRVGKQMVRVVSCYNMVLYQLSMLEIRKD